MTQQPDWKLLANLGDQNPLDYDGYFVFIDQNHTYAPEAELLLVNEDDTYTIYRFSLDQCTYQNGILSDNPYHPDYPAWFAQPECQRVQRPQDTNYLADVANSAGMPVNQLIPLFCSTNPIDLANAYRMVGDYHGWENLDQYPLQLSKQEVEQRYKDLDL